MLSKNRLSLCGLIVATLCMSACDSGQETDTETTVVRPVKLITINAAGDEEVNQFPAVIDADQLSELSLQVGGMLQEFPVVEAQDLKRGDLIARLDQSDFNSAVASARAQFENAEQEYQRGLRLAEEDAIARNVVEQRKAQFDVSQAQLDQAEKALADSELRAPFDGIVAQTLVKSLQTVSAGQELVKFMSSDRLQATVDLPASYLASIPRDETNSSARQAFVILDAAPDQFIEAEFEEASLIADSSSQTYEIAFSFSPPENLLVLPGMNATVELRFQNAQESVRIAVPLDAMTSDGQTYYVWAVDRETMTVSKRAVTIEEGVGTTVVVTSGLQANDTLVGAGAAYLSEGMQIREWK